MLPTAHQVLCNPYSFGGNPWHHSISWHSILDVLSIVQKDIPKRGFLACSQLFFSQIVFSSYSSLLSFGNPIRPLRTPSSVIFAMLTLLGLPPDAVRSTARCYCPVAVFISSGFWLLLFMFMSVSTIDWELVRMESDFSFCLHGDLFLFHIGHTFKSWRRVEICWIKVSAKCPTWYVKINVITVGCRVHLCKNCHLYEEETRICSVEDFWAQHLKASLSLFCGIFMSFCCITTNLRHLSGL